MKKRILAIMLVVACLCSILITPAHAASYVNKKNTFDVYQSNGYTRITSNNSGATMKSLNYKGTYGTITFHTRFDFKVVKYLGDGDVVEYKLPNGIYDGAKIYFYLGSTRIGVGKIHTYNGGKTFGSIIKIDSIGGGNYLKYT